MIEIFLICSYRVTFYFKVLRDFMTREHQMASFPRLREYRVALGWEITDLAKKLQNSPRISSLYNLERGKKIRLVSVRRVFTIINKAHHGTLKFDEEVFLD